VQNEEERNIHMDVAFQRNSTKTQQNFYTRSSW